MGAYAEMADKLRERGYSAIPIQPGTKVPGDMRGGQYRPLSGWQQYGYVLPASFIHERWCAMPGAGVGIAHGRVVALDIDTDRADVRRACYAAITPSVARRRGRKGELGYYLGGDALAAHGARVRWYDGEAVAVELLLGGSQSVLPPSIHPDTNKPYIWIGEAGLSDLDMDELPAMPGDAVALLDAALGVLGLTRQAPRRLSKSHRPSQALPSGADLDKPYFRSINDRALEPQALDGWWPALAMPKSRQRGPGLHEAVACWRPSSSGRPNSERNPNLKASPGGIVDFGEDRAYTAIDVVVQARDCSCVAAAEWLAPYLRPEQNFEHMEVTAPALRPAPPPAAPQTPPPEHKAPPADWSATPTLPPVEPGRPIVPSRLPTPEEYAEQVPADPGPFPIQNVAASIPGLLGETAAWIDAASPTATETGGLAVALPLLGALMGRSYATPSNLRTNIYTAALGPSGSGKTSLVRPAKELLLECGVQHVLGPDRVASGSGLIATLAAHPRRVLFLDEFGHMLQQLGSPGAGIHARQILTEFTQLYSAAGTFYTGTAYATREPDPIDCPHLCLFGMATPDQFWAAFGSGNLEDGSIARYLIMPLGRSQAKDPDERHRAELVEGLKALLAAIGARVNGNLGQPALCVARISPEAERERLALRRTMVAMAEYAEITAIRGAGPILRRVTENALKIALVSAVGRDPRAPILTKPDFDIGHAVARWSACTMIANIASHIADNQIERDVNEVERFIAEAGEKGRTWREVQRKFRRIRGRDLRDIVESLEREEVVRVEVDVHESIRRPVKRLLVI